MLLAEGVYSVGQKKGGRVHAYLFENDGELTLVDTLFDTDAHRRARRDSADRADPAGPEADRADARAPLAPRRARQAQGAERRTVYAHEWEADIIAGERAQQPVTLVPHGPLSTYY